MLFRFPLAHCKCLYSCVSDYKSDTTTARCLSSKSDTAKVVADIFARHYDFDG